MKNRFSDLLTSLTLAFGLVTATGLEAKNVKPAHPAAKSAAKPARAHPEARSAAKANPTARTKSETRHASTPEHKKPATRGKTSKAETEHPRSTKPSRQPEAKDRHPVKPGHTGSVHPARKPSPALKAQHLKPSAAPAKAQIAGGCSAKEVASRQHVKYLTNLDTGEVLSGMGDADKKFFQASVTKIMPIYMTLRLEREGKLDPEKPVAIPRIAFKNARGDVDGHDVIPKNVTRATPQTLRYAARISSSNLAAHALAVAAAGSEEKFAELANQYARELGMVSNFSNASGYPTADAVKNQWTTAKDTTILMAALQREFPKEIAALNVTSKKLVGYKKGSDQPVEFKIKTRIEAQDSSYQYHVPELGFMKTGFACRTGLAGVGVVKVSGVNVSFMMAGYPSYQARDKDLNIEIARIEKKIADDKVMMASRANEGEPVEFVIPLSTRPETPSLSETQAPLDKSMQIALLLAAASGIGFAAGRVSRKRKEPETSPDAMWDRPAIATGRSLNVY